MTEGLAGLFFVGFVLVYFAAYLLVIERVKDKSLRSHSHPESDLQEAVFVLLRASPTA